MLLELRVKALGIIEDITWKPAAGFNVITGETGAGKSLVVDAVEALLTGQIQEEDIRHGSDEAQLEGVFLISQNEESARLNRMLAEKGLAPEEKTLVLTCDFRRQGRATFRVNRQAVARNLLRDIGGLLVDIHGQSDHLSLLNKDQHLNLLDSYAHTWGLRRSFSEKVARLSEVEREIQLLLDREQGFARQADFLRFQINEIKESQVHPGEEEELEREHVLLVSAEKLKEASYEVYKSIYDDEETGISALDRLNAALPALREIVNADSTLKSHLDYLTDAVHGLQELARAIRSYGDALEYEPRRLDEVETRLELIRNLKKKYGKSVNEVLAYLAKAEKELEGLSNSTERRQQLEVTRDRLKKEMGETACQLSGARTQAAGRLVTAVKEQLSNLNMAQVEFEVSILQEPSADGIPFANGELYGFNPDGVDNVEFMASTNPGEPIRPLARVASTGELSRFMLALKSALAEADTIPVLIFDEIDIGVGGRSGEIIGEKLWNLARNRQVVCVTHLPQIAVFADAHFSVRKERAGDRTISMIEELKGDSRLGEVATMLAGPEYTKTSLDTAEELMRKAQAWKELMNRDKRKPLHHTKTVPPQF